jgi:hypothetical protein
MTKWTTYLATVLVALAFAIPASAQTGKWYSHYAQVLGERAQAGAALSEQIERARWYSHYAQVLGERAQAGAALSEQIERARARE